MTGMTASPADLEDEVEVLLVGVSLLVVVNAFNCCGECGFFVGVTKLIYVESA